ncbi:MAG: serine/threonine protein kinase [Anaerolineae bacterium]|nr:serine/threonine protein kinase [Anaerolineae bacterium]
MNFNIFNPKSSEVNVGVELRIGDTFDEFEILEKIGTGAFSSVFLAYDPMLDRKVVLKNLSPELSDNQDEWDAFVNEAQTTASLVHPGLITVHSLRIDAENQSAVLVMEYMDGGTLRDMIEHHGPLDPELIWNLAHQVGEALTYLHGRGIVHRDIKPENILFSRETGWFKLTDFGLAFNPDRPEFESLNDGQPGTLIYMAPEQARNEHVTPQSDLYTFAAVLYEALTGSHYLPQVKHYEGQPRRAVQQIQDAHPPRLPMVCQDIELVDQLESILFKALAKHSHERFSSVRRFVRAFNRVVEDIDHANRHSRAAARV